MVWKLLCKIKGIFKVIHFLILMKKHGEQNIQKCNCTMTQMQLQLLSPDIEDNFYLISRNIDLSHCMLSFKGLKN